MRLARFTPAWPAIALLGVLAAATLAAPGAGQAAARGAKVRVLVVGRDGTLAETALLRASATAVRAGRRRCAVAASTPLAALRAAARAARISFGVRDYGSCSRRTPRDSGQLFVNRVAADRNRGQDGWFYKVTNRAGSAGAADPAGPFGAGRIRSGQDVIWFYCVFDQAAAGCQRNLVVRPEAGGAPAGGPVAVRVTGYDNEGRGVPVAGATVTLGRATVLTDAAGRASLPAPATAGLGLRATKPGFVPSFTETLAAP